MYSKKLWLGELHWKVSLSVYAVDKHIDLNSLLCIFICIKFHLDLKAIMGQGNVAPIYISMEMSVQVWGYNCVFISCFSQNVCNF